MFSEPKIVSDKDQNNSYSGYVAMENLIDKLKILNFDSEFTSALKMKPIHKYYFIVPKNPGEQFYLFTCLAAWLICKCGKTFETPQESDDPNTTVSNILDAVREFGIIVDFPPNKLKQGVGEHVTYILNCLAEKAIERMGFTLKKPMVQVEQDDESEIIEDESEIVLDRVEEEMLAYYSDESDDDNIFNLNDSQVNKVLPANEAQTANIDQENWYLEMERVLPKLKVTIRTDTRDWRSNLEQMKQYEVTINQCFGGAKYQLEKLQKDISHTLEKISNREKYLNRELEPVLAEYRTLQDQLSKIKDVYQNISGGVTERTRELAKLTERLETVKQEMEQRGSSMTDGTPLVNIKRAISKIKSEIVEMDVRIGVLQCLLLQIKIRDKKLLEDDLGQSTGVL
ncbi:ift57/hippi [Holotrichia oblita]|uniref:Ift57/hippi n=1 Tax=Holotrichia oblita TaxID=644536 RepID=A0ACB9T9W2_HOLOL|nr:ift57/hippi [Holotrichia oblita]